MKKFVKYLFLAVMAAITLAGCEKEKVNPLLSPSGTPVKFTLSAQTVSKTAAQLKVTADVPVPVDVAIDLALDATSTMTKGLTFPAKLIVKQGETEAVGTITVEEDKLDPGSNTTCVIAASYANVKFGTVEVFTIETDPAPYVPMPDKDGFTADGDPSEWEAMENVFTIDCAEGAELDGLKMVKVHYGSNLHFLFEVTDEALAKGVEDGKLRLHIFFDGDNKHETGLIHKWDVPAIDYMLEGKMTSGGDYCAFASSYYEWTGETATDWTWTDSGVSAKIIDSAGQDNYYELTLDYSKYPGGLGKVINLGFDIADGDYALMGCLPNAAGEDPAPMVLVWKDDYIFPDEDGFTADGKDAEWKDREGVVEIKSTPEALAAGLASAKVYYGKKRLHFLVELTDEALAAEELYLNLLFNGDGKTTGGMAYVWAEPGIDYIVSGIIAKAGKYLPFDSQYYVWGNVDFPSEWGFKGTDIRPEIDAAGSGKFYEISMDYSTYPGGLAEEFGFAALINDGKGEVLGYLPNSADEENPASLDVVSKVSDINIDGNAADWDKLDQKYVTSMVCPEDAALNGLKSAKVYYDDKLYMLLEVTDDALATGVTDGKLRFHIFFNGQNGTGLATNDRWTNYDYATEGKMTSGGTYCAYSSSVYSIAPGTAWDTSNTGIAPTFVAKGEGNFYELSMDYSDFPGGLADTFGIGFDIADGNYTTIGYLPNAAEPCDLALVTKAAASPAEPGPEPVDEGIKIDGKFDDWEEIEGTDNGNYGMFKVASDEDNLYFFSYRNTGGRYSDLWGDGVGYIYIGLDLDNNLETGVELLGNGNYEVIWYFYCFGGSAAAPVIGITAEGGIAPDTYTIANMQVKGVAGDDGARLEYSIPRADLPEIPSHSITVYSWGNKDLNKVSIECFL